MNLNFEGHFDRESTSVCRARETDSEVTEIGDTHLVAFEDSEDVHEVELTYTVDGWRGVCYTVDHNGERTGHCPGLEYHDGPCAHLWLVRSQCVRPIRPDGGRVEAPAAGEDGKVFGRPEMAR